MAKKNNKIKDALINVGKKIISETYKGKNPSITFPLRSLSNISFDKEKGTLVLGNKTGTRSFFDMGHTRKFLQTIEVAKVSKNLLNEGKHASLRDVFYQLKRTIPFTKINVVDEQSESDSVIEDLELVTGFPRESLNINANKNGSIAGNVIVKDKGDIIDWSKLGSGGWSVPSNVEDIEFKKVKAKFILYMEKAAVWERLHEDRFWDKHNCIIIASQGQTTRGIRRLLQRMYTEHKLPIYILADFDPWGFYIYSVIKFGSISLAHMAGTTAIPGVKFLGITADDIEKYGLKKHLINFKETDINRLKQMAAYEWFADNKAWQRQFKLMKQMGAKAEIQALSARGISFISDKYLPQKIKNKDFID